MNTIHSIKKSEYKVLKTLTQGMTYRGIYGNTNVTMPTVRNSIKHLIELGFVESYQQEDINFGRVFFFKRTDKGNTLLELFNGQDV